MFLRKGQTVDTGQGFISLVENVTDMVFRYDAAGLKTFTFVNSAAQDITGYGAQEFMERPELLHRIMIPDDGFHPKNLEEMLVEGARKNLTIRLRRKDGDEAWVRMRNVLIRDKAGRVQQVEGILIDMTQENKARQSLEESKETYRIFFSASAMAMVIVDEQGNIEESNDEFSMFSNPEVCVDCLGVNFSKFLNEESSRKFKSYLSLSMGRSEVTPRGFYADFLDQEGVIKPVYLFLSPVPEKKRSVITVLDLPELHVAREAVGIQKHYFSQLFQNSPLGIAFLDSEGRIVDINQGYTNMFGYELAEVRNKANRLFLAPEHLNTEVDINRKSVLAGKTLIKETVRKKKDGGEIPVMLRAYPLYLGDEIGGMFFIYEDISERKAYEEQLARNALYDSLTELPNRTLFLERVKQAVKRARGTQEGVSSVMMLDLDRFRMINETYGHLAGDGVIKEIPERLEGLFSASDTMARLAGDQFGFLVENYKTKRDVLVKATEVIKAVGRAFELNGDDVHLACDIGVVFNLGDYEKSEDVIRDAEVALQQSKAERDKTRIKVFSKGMHEEVAEALSVENEMRKAVREDQFQVYYQPIISLENEQVVGFEALMRWFHPGLGEITPVRFIPVAEHTGLILKMGADILKTACLQLVEWQEELAGFPDLVMSVNVSPKQLGDRTVNEMLDRVLSETRVDPQNLKLEITESLIMHDTRAAMKFFENLRSRGVRLAIDDFGTGYSSLGYLHRFPVDYLKIAKSFVSGESAADENRTIIKSIVNLAENLGFKVIAEGAETREQVDMLKELGCHEVQGFYFARPMEPHEALAFLREQATGRT